MFISKIKVNGLFSYENLDINLENNLNIFVGTNGTGKTNLLNLIKYSFDDIKKLLKCVNKNIQGNKEIIIHLKIENISNNDIKINKLMLLNFIFPFNNDLRCKTDKNFNLIKNIFKLLNNKTNEIIITHTIYNNNINTKINTNEILCNENSKIDILNSRCECNDEKCMIKEYIKGSQSMNNFVDCSWLINDFEKYLFYENQFIINHYFSQEECDLKIKNNKKILNNETFLKILNDIIFYTPKNTYCNFYNFCSIIENTQHINELLNISQHKALIKNFCIINKEYILRKLMFKFKQNEPEKYNQIQERYNQICGKKFNVIIESKGFFNDYIFVNQNYHECSFGEYELLYFLLKIYDEDTIVLYDEPCSHINSGNKYLLLSDNKIFDNKQVIIVSHDKEFINLNNIPKLYYFNMINGKTTIKNFNNMFKNEQHKIIFENPEILFNNKIIIVEGFTDYLIISKLLKNYTDIIVLYVGGKTSRIYEIIKELDIENKTKYLYDIDVLSKNSCEQIFKGIKKDKKTIKFINTRITNIDLSKFDEIHNIANFINQNNKNIYIHNCSVKDIEGLLSIILNEKITKNNRDKNLEKFNEIINNNYDDVIKKPKINSLITFLTDW